jgi:F-type H+-transporting ATPase subunit a
MVVRSIKSLLVAVFSLCISLISNTSYAQPNHENEHKTEHAPAPGEKGHGGEEKLDPAKVIMDHIKDAHYFHFFTIENKEDPHKSFHATIPLPILLYSPQRGFSFFSSSHFGHENEEVYEGYKLENGHIIPVDAAGKHDESVKVFDFSMTKNVVQMLIALTLLVLLMTNIAKKYKRGEGVKTAPKGWQNAIEPIITFLRDEVGVVNLGKKSDKYMPYLLTVFFFILINNIFGLIPGLANVTGNTAFPIVLGVIAFFVILFSTNKYFWAHTFNPHVPAFVKPILVPVEVAGIFIKPVALIIRLFANMVAGHIIILSFISLIFIFGGMSKIAGWGFSPFSILFTVFIYFIEILVAFIQAFIFTNLTAVFIGQAFEGGHDDVDGHDDGIIA